MKFWNCENGDVVFFFFLWLGFDNINFNLLFI